MKQQNEVIMLRNVRLSFPSLFQPKVGDEPGAKPKFAATFLLDKKVNAKEIAAIKAAIEKTKQTSDKLKGNKRPLKSPLRDGTEKEHLEGYNDSVMFISARNHRKPGVVDQQLNELLESDGKPYAGCYVHARVECYGYTHPKSGPGITFSLLNVQFVRDGEAFGEAPMTNQAEGFAPVEDESVV